jgi:hypothetical protein
MHRLFTDPGIDASMRAKLEAMGIEVILADM